LTSAPAGNGGWRGLVKDVLAKVFSYADRPWRAFFILVLIVVLGTGFLVYVKRDELLTLYLTHLERTYATMTLRTDLEVPVVQVFASKAAVDAVSIWSIDLALNKVVFLFGQRRDGSHWDIAPHIMMAFSDTSDPTLTSHMLIGQPTCSDPAKYQFLTATALVADHMSYVCFIPVPSSRFRLLIGFILIAWRNDPGKPLAEAAVATVLRERFTQ
jgi:hypothetical protein